MFKQIKQLTKDTAIYGISTMVSRFLSFFLVPFYTNIFIPEDYGIITNIYAFIGLLSVIFLYGMDAAYLKYDSEPSIGGFKDKFSTPFLSVLIVAFFFSLLLILTQEPILKLLAVPQKFYYLIFLIAPILFLDAISSIPFIKLRIERRAKKFALFKTLNILINVTLNLFLILKLKWGIEAVFVSNLLASFASFLMTLPIVLKNLKFDFNTLLLKRLLKFGLPYLPAGLAAMVIQVIDRPIMEHLTDLNTLGIYQANYKLGIFMMLFVNMFQYAWQPFFLQEAKTENAKEVFAKVLTYFTLAGSIILMVISLFIDNIVKINFEIFGKQLSLIGSAYWSGLDIVPVVLLGYLFNGLYVVFTVGIYLKEKSIYAPIITGTGAVVNIVVNFILIPLMGIMGAALATLASYLVMAIGFYLVTQKFYKINYEYDKIIKIFSSIILIGIIYYNLLYNGNLFLIYKIIMLILFLLFISFFVIEKNEFISLKRNLGFKRK